MFGLIRRFEVTAFFLTAVVCLAASVAMCQPAVAQQSPASTQATAPAQATVQEVPLANQAKAHGAMPLELSKSLDSKKLRENDAVAGQITADLHMHDGLTIPKNSKVLGHVTESKARSKGDPESKLVFVFDKIVPPGKDEMAIKGTLQAIAPKQENGSADTGGGPSMMAGHGSAGTVPPPMPTTPGQQMVRPVLTPQTKGTVGFKDLKLQDGALTSNGKEIKLDSGTQMIVLVEIQ
jgi:hypothetical protein